MEESKTLFFSSKFPRARKRIYSKFIHNLGTRLKKVRQPWSECEWQSISLPIHNNDPHPLHPKDGRGLSLYCLIYSWASRPICTHPPRFVFTILAQTVSGTHKTAEVSNSPLTCIKYTMYFTHTHTHTHTYIYIYIYICVYIYIYIYIRF